MNATRLLINTPGFSRKLYVDHLVCACGDVEDGVGFQIDDDGGWVIALSELKQIVKLAEQKRKELKSR